MPVEPVAAGVEVDGEPRLAPGGDPKIDERRQIGLDIVAQGHGAEPLALGQLELDPAVAGEQIVVGSLVDRLELAEARRRQPVRLDALGDQILHHRDGARGRQLPVRLELAIAVQRPVVGVAVDAQDPGDVGGDFPLEIEDGGGERIERFLAGAG